MTDTTTTNITKQQLCCRIMLSSIAYIIGGTNITDDAEAKMITIITSKQDSFKRGEIYGISAILQPIIDECIKPDYTINDINRDRIINALFAGLYLIRNIGD